jgi:hypothetical protein
VNEILDIVIALVYFGWHAEPKFSAPNLREVCRDYC